MDVDVGCSSATVSNITFSLLPVAYTYFSGRCGVKTAKSA